MANELRAHFCCKARHGLANVVARIYSEDMQTLIAEVPLSETIPGSYIGDVPAGLPCGEYPVHIYDITDALNPKCLAGGTLDWDVSVGIMH